MLQLDLDSVRELDQRIQQTKKKTLAAHARFCAQGYGCKRAVEADEGELYTAMCPENQHGCRIPFYGKPSWKSRNLGATEQILLRGNPSLTRKWPREERSTNATSSGSREFASSRELWFSRKDIRGTLPRNRPVSLLNSLYKLFCALSQKEFQKPLESTSAFPECFLTWKRLAEFWNHAYGGVSAKTQAYNWGSLKDTLCPFETWLLPPK